MVQSDSMRVLDILANASAVIAEGEVAQLTTANDTATDEDGYLDVVSARKRQRCSPLPAGSARLSASAQTDEEMALDQYGLNLGIAFQLVDDFLDYARGR